LSISTNVHMKSDSIQIISHNQSNNPPIPPSSYSSFGSSFLAGFSSFTGAFVTALTSGTD